MMVWDPSAGGFIEFSSRYVDPALGFAMGWQFWFQTIMTTPVEIVAASIVIQYWDTNPDHLGICKSERFFGSIHMLIFLPRRRGDHHWNYRYQLGRCQVLRRI